MALKISPHIVETENGVYQPFALTFDIALALIVMSLLLIVSLSFVFASGENLRSSMMLYSGLFAALAVVRLNQFRKYGELGKPSVALDGNVLLIGQPGSTQSILHVALPDIHALIIYGIAGRRHLRFVRHDATFFEAVPGWERSVEAAIMRFLENRLPPTIKVTVEESQTIFASMRGDGPAQ
jgi:hypothetical protein